MRLKSWSIFVKTSCLEIQFLASLHHNFNKRCESAVWHTVAVNIEEFEPATRRRVFIHVKITVLGEESRHFLGGHIFDRALLKLKVHGLREFRGAAVLISRLLCIVLCRVQMQDSAGAKVIKH